jgi:hypothetical protein
VNKRFHTVTTIVGVCLCVISPPAFAQDRVDYRVVATNKTSTMEKEMNAAAEAGFRFGGVMGGDTAFGGSEVVVVMTKAGVTRARVDYRLLAANRTSTMEKELQQAGDAGYEYKGQSVFKSAFGGREVVVILERDKDAPDAGPSEYRLMATKKTGTLQKELVEAGKDGFHFVGLTVAETLVGGSEVVAILRRTAR